MKKILNFLKSSIKYILIFLCGFMFAQCGARAKDTISASADASTVTADTQIDYDGMTIDPFQYPTANLLNWPYSYSNYVSNGSLTYQVKDNGIVNVSGILTVDYAVVFPINYENIYFINGATYSLALYDFNDLSYKNKFLQVDCYVMHKDGNRRHLGSAYLGYAAFTFTVPEDVEFLRFALVAAPTLYDGNAIDIDCAIMFNQGATAYPYQPPYQLVYANGYNNGADGAYDSGFNDGLNQSQYGPFYDAKIYVREWETAPDGGSGPDGVTEEYAPDYINMGLDFSKISSNIGTAVCYDLIIDFKSPVVASQVKQMIVFANSAFSYDYYGTPMTAKLYFDNGRYQSYDFEYNQNFGGAIIALPSNFGEAITAIQFDKIKSADAFNNLMLAISDNAYFIGYEDGVYAGENSQSVKDKITDAQNKGLEQGKLIGYENAVSEGVDGIGIFYSLIAIIKILFKLLGDCMTWKIAGDLTIGLFVIGIPATFMIINLIIKLVKGLAGGGGSE